MKVILMSKIKNLGNIGDIKEVADGYGRNFLLPKKLAVPYSKENYEIFEVKKQQIEEENEKILAEDMKIKNELEKLDIIIIENAGDTDKLYGSVTSLRIANCINELLKSKKKVSKSNVIIKYPIKELGLFKINIDLSNDISFEKDLYVVRSMEDVKKLKESKEITSKK